MVSSSITLSPATVPGLLLSFLPRSYTVTSHPPLRSTRARTTPFTQRTSFFHSRRSQLPQMTSETKKGFSFSPLAFPIFESLRSWPFSRKKWRKRCGTRDRERCWSKVQMARGPFFRPFFPTREPFFVPCVSSVPFNLPWTHFERPAQKGRDKKP